MLINMPSKPKAAKNREACSTTPHPQTPHRFPSYIERRGKVEDHPKRKRHQAGGFENITGASLSGRPWGSALKAET